MKIPSREREDKARNLEEMFANHMCKDIDNEPSKLNSKNITQK